MNIPAWNNTESPFHAGSRTLQERLGIARQMEQRGRQGIRTFMPEQHRSFFAQLPFLLVGSRAADGQPWASILCGQPGFIASPSPTALTIRATPLAGDPFAANLQLGSQLGLLGIEPTTRRRNRMNGRVSAVDGDTFTVAVEQSFGNCPQYIQSRRHHWEAPAEQPAIERADSLDAAARTMIQAADTLFIASAHPEGVDVSHRGGKAGFVRVEGNTLTLPDFVGNYHFKTFGNLQLEPRAGLLFIDFTTGELLYLAARAELIWEGEEIASFVGAERLLRLEITQMIRVRCALPLRFETPEYSPLLTATGSWEDATHTLAAKRQAQTWRRLRLAAVVAESSTVRSLYLETVDGSPLPPYSAGQYLPIRLALPGEETPVLRTYTLSDAAGAGHYRLSVKRDGLVSSWLHQAAIGAEIEALSPRGEFVFERGSGRPAVLLSAGIGITPMLAMLNSLLVNGNRSRHPHPIHFIHMARNSAELPFHAHLLNKQEGHANLHLHIAFSAAMPQDNLGVSHHSEGRLNIETLKALLPLDDYDFYLCGPAGFMQEMYDGLRAIGVRDERIRAEAFGPSTLHRNVENEPADTGQMAVAVSFRQSGKQVEWRKGSLLELAEANGIAALSSCRQGICGSCVTQLLAGQVEYASPPVADIQPGEALLCCARPHPGSGKLELEL